jgi:DNA polymerase III sliding clamp (beta) subunit (PCNA family)
MIYMSGTKFIFKEKTEKYKKQVVELEHAQSNEITTEETIVLLNGDIEINVSFTFNLFYLFDSYTILTHDNFKMDCNDDLKPSVEKFIENNYFDKDVFDFDDDE